MPTLGYVALAAVLVVLSGRMAVLIVAFSAAALMMGPLAIVYHIGQRRKFGVAPRAAPS